MDCSFFDADYYLRGPATGKSNYDNYRWMPELTGEMADALIDRFALLPGSSFLDYGCARGYLVRALRERGIEADGYDVSEWATAHCDHTVKDHIYNDFRLLGGRYDFAMAKDVFEHVEWPVLEYLIPELMHKCGQLLVIVPVAQHEGGEFPYPPDNQDPSHINRHTATGWLGKLCKIWGKTHVCFPGPETKAIIKPASASHPGSTAFFILEN